MELPKARIGLLVSPRLIIRPGLGFEDKPARPWVGTQPLSLLLQAPGPPQTFLRRAAASPRPNDLDLGGIQHVLNLSGLFRSGDPFSAGQRAFGSMAMISFQSAIAFLSDW